MSKIILKIDNRERDIIKIINDVIAKDNLEDKIEVSIEVLDIGDFIITDHNGKELLIIERKSVNDLAASIQDGRYKEQSMRLDACEVHNHNIIYMIEGSINKYSNKHCRITKEALYSSLFSMNYYKGFSVIRSEDMNETTTIIVKFIKKILREKTLKPHYINSTRKSSPSIVENEIISTTPAPLEYHQVIKRNKKSNITPENIGYIMLSQIPGISGKMSQVIMDKHGSLYELIIKLKENPLLLNNDTYVTEKGQTRKINYKCIESIKKYLL